MYLVGEHGLAHAALAEQQNGGVGGGHPQDLVQRGMIGRRAAHRAIQLGQAAARLGQAEGRGDQAGRCGRLRGLRHRLAAAMVGGARLEVLEVFLGVVPFLHRPRHGPAHLVAAGAALGLAYQDALAHQAGQEARAVAHFHPADRIAAGAVAGHMQIALHRMLPEELAVQVALALVELDAHRGDFDHAGQGVQLRAGGEDVELGAAGTGLDGQVGIAHAGEVADAGEHPAGELDPHGFDQLLTQGAEGLRVQQEHAFLAEPDQPFLGIEEQVFGEVLHVGETQVGDDATGVAAPSLACACAVFARGRAHGCACFSSSYPQCDAEVGRQHRLFGMLRTSTVGDFMFFVPNFCCLRKIRKGCPLQGAAQRAPQVSATNPKLLKIKDILISSGAFSGAGTGVALPRESAGSSHGATDRGAGQGPPEQ
ncbi:hypothetical protein D3C78_658400 [compost metagenome]